MSETSTSHYYRMSYRDFCFSKDACHPRVIKMMDRRCVSKGKWGRVALRRVNYRIFYSFLFHGQSLPAPLYNHGYIAQET